MIGFSRVSRSSLETHRAAAMEGRRYRIEPWSGESDNPFIRSGGPFALFGEGAFFGYFLCTSKESNSPFRAKLLSRFSMNQCASTSVGCRRIFALARESLFFVWPKKSNQKKGHPGGTPALCAGSQAEWEFPYGTSMCPPKTPCILRGALRVLPIRPADPRGPERSKPELLDALLLANRGGGAYS